MVLLLQGKCPKFASSKNYLLNNPMFYYVN